MSMIMPICEKIFSVSLKIQRLSTAPAIARGTVSHDNERITEAFKLGGQDQVNQDQGK